MRNRFDPLRVHCASELLGQLISVRKGTRTRIASGCQSPFLPSDSTGRNRSAPKHERPKLLSGSSCTSTFWESSRVKPSSRLSRTSNDSSSVPISIFSLCWNASGVSLFTTKESFPSCGTSSELPRRMAAAVGPGSMFFTTRSTFGRGGSTVAAKSTERPSFQRIFAVNLSPG